jgi:hypothetical protein
MQTAVAVAVNETDKLLIKQLAAAVVVLFILLLVALAHTGDVSGECNEQVKKAKIDFAELALDLFHVRQNKSD